MKQAFVRARKPEEKEARRQAILVAARRLTREVGPSDFSLSELARRSGVSKPNIYRYFESREEVLLQVWVEEVRAVGEQMKARLVKVRRGDVGATAKIVVASFVELPQFGELMCLVAPVLERSLSVEAIVTAKRTLVELLSGIASALHAALPALSLESCRWSGGVIATYVAGLWPATHPAPSVKKALQLPELAGMHLSFEIELTRFLEVLFAGLLGKKAR